MLRPRGLAPTVALLLATAPAGAQLTPFVVTELAHLTDPEGAAGDAFGGSASLDTGALLVGAPGDDPGGSTSVFTGAGHEWELQARLEAPGAQAGDDFGASVGLSGGTALVGAPGADGSGAAEAGSAWVFVAQPAGWSVQALLAAPGAASGDGFGAAVAVAGDTLVVGAPGRDGPGAADAGAAYVFVRNGATWTLQALLVASDAAADDGFGAAVALQGDTLLVGSPEGGPPGQPDAGASYVFVRSGGAWSEQARLAASDAASGDAFGASVALSGDTALVGAELDDHPGGADAGAAYVFVRDAGAWSQQARLTASGGASGDAFGASVSVSGDTALVGAPGDTLAAVAQAGSAHVFVRSGSFWSQHAKVSASDAAPQAAFGRAACVVGETLLVGAPSTALPAAHARGEAWVYRFGLVGSWQDLGAGLAGSAGVPQLYGTGELLARSDVTLVLAQAKPASVATLVVGLELLGAPFKGGTLVPDADLVLPALTDGAGGIVLEGRWPDGVPSGFSTWFQWWIADVAGPAGLAASNAVSGTTP